MHTLTATLHSKRTATFALHGFTLIEVLVVVAVLGVLAALAAPSFAPLITKWRVQQAVENMKTSLYFARSEAIKRGGLIGMQKHANGTEGCTNAQNKQEWGCGWFIFEDTNQDGKWQKTEALLQTMPAPTEVNVMHIDGAASFKVDKWGMMNGLNAKGYAFTPVNGNPSSPAARGLCVSSGGRIKVTESIVCK